METPAGNSRQPGIGAQCRPGPGPSGGPRAAVLGSLTIPGHPGKVREARTFVARTLSSHRLRTDDDAATLLTSEVVTNAIQHSRSGTEGGTVTIVVIQVPHGILIEVIDDGSAGTPIVKGDLYAAEGHGLYLVQHLAAQWGYLRDPASTTVWFHLPTADEQRQTAERTGPQAAHRQRPNHAEPGRATSAPQRYAPRRPQPDRTATAGARLAPGGVPAPWAAGSPAQRDAPAMTGAGVRTNGNGGQTLDR